MALRRTIEGGKLPQENPSSGNFAKEFKFKVGAVDQVRVKVKSGITARAIALPARDSDVPPMPGVFEPGRLAINLKLDSQPGKSIGAIERIRIDDEDLAFAGSNGAIKVAYFYLGKWFPMSVDWSEPGLALISLADFPADPPIAIGR